MFKEKKFKIIVSLCILGVVIALGIGGKIYMENQHQEKSNREKEVIKVESMFVEALKNKYEDIKVVEFDGKYANAYDEMTGWSFTINITTSKGTSSPGMVSYSPKEKNKVGGMGPVDSNFEDVVKKGKTETVVSVIYSDGSKGEI